MSQAGDSELNASATGPQQTNIPGLHNSRRTSQQKLIATPKVIVPVSSFSSEGVDSIGYLIPKYRC
jgi:hypothetical protein